MEERYVEYWKDMKNMEEKSWIVKRYGKYGRKLSWIVKRFGKYRRKLWNDRENMEESRLNSEKIWKIQKKIVKRYEKYGRKESWKLKLNQWDDIIQYPEQQQQQPNTR